MLTKVMTNKFMELDTLAKRCLVKSKKYAAVLSVLVKEFEKVFKIAKKKIKFLVYSQLCFQLT